MKIISKLFFTLAFFVFLNQSNCFALSDSCKKLTEKSTEIEKSFCSLDGLSNLFDKKFEEATKSFDAILKIDDQNESALANKATALLRLERKSEALDNFRLALSIINSKLLAEPKNGELYYKRGTLFRRVNLYDQAVKDLEKAVALSPKRDNYPLDLKATRIEARPPSSNPIFSIEEMEEKK